MLGILQHTPIQTLAHTSAQAIHYFSEAGRLAFADRDAYIADPIVMTVDPKLLLDAAYLQQRASLIRPDRSMTKASPGDPVGMGQVNDGVPALELPSTTHLVAADRHGGVVSMTTSIESAFGSKIFTQGFLLNNELTDFSFVDHTATGKAILNHPQGGKRPRSSMAPTIVFKQDQPYLATGSPGGSAIILYVAKTLMGVLDWGLDIQQAIDLPNYGSRNQATELEEGRGLAPQANVLRAMGHEVKFVSFPSGIQGIHWIAGGLEGGADPRREGTVMGD